MRSNFEKFAIDACESTVHCYMLLPRKFSIRYFYLIKLQLRVVIIKKQVARSCSCQRLLGCRVANAASQNRSQVMLCSYHTQGRRKVWKSGDGSCNLMGKSAPSDWDGTPGTPGTTGLINYLTLFLISKIQRRRNGFLPDQPSIK